jgi:nucleolar GTP-binding protein
MVVYNFKKIQPIPNATEFIDIVLTRTQRKTPTVIHPGYKITRIRSFYMRKVKFTEQTVTEKLGAILFEFPRLDDIHPFYADLMNILYDRDHYKLALGQVNTAKNIISGLAKDYLRLLKYGDSLYRCKQLKRAALGRMCTVLKKLKAALGYLEEVRKHISRLPALDPSTRTLLLTGYPNVGKSSFMNKVTRADVDVQPYAFTTKALFVGHMDHRFLRWQVVDTPGILDRPLEERNTIEMQAITALAHLQCCVLYFLDISEQCGYPLDQQLRLFESIRPLFANKQVMMVANKTDVIPYESLSAAHRAAIEEVAATAGAELITMSNISEENISQLKTRACDKLLEARVESKLSAGRLKDDVLARITVALPKKRDNAVRESFIPESVLATRSGERMDAARTTEKQLMIANGGAGVYVCDYRKYYQLEEDEWKWDAIPEIMDGKNVIDFYDADIEDRLRQLEEEEAELERQGAYAPEESDDDDLDEDELALHAAIVDKQLIARKNSHVTPTPVPRKFSQRGRGEEEIREKLDTLGYDSSGLIESIRGRKRNRSLSTPRAAGNDADGMETEQPTPKKRTSSRSESVVNKQNRGSSKSATRGPKADLNQSQKKQVYKSVRSMERKIFGEARGGEADRRHYPKLVKHLNSGKRSLGTSTIGR